MHPLSVQILEAETLKRDPKAATACLSTKAMNSLQASTLAASMYSGFSQKTLPSKSAATMAAKSGVSNKVAILPKKVSHSAQVTSWKSKIETNSEESPKLRNFLNYKTSFDCRGCVIATDIFRFVLANS